MAPKTQRERAKLITGKRTYTTTVRMPVELHDELKIVLDQGAFGSFNELLVSAVQNLLKALRERAVDQQFARMAEDENYQKVALNLYNLFENSALEEQATAVRIGGAKKQWPEGLGQAALRSIPPIIKVGG